MYEKDRKIIYIPIWLDLLSTDIQKTRPGTLIYIPIWLDLLSVLVQYYQLQMMNLHSNMVRFIIGKREPLFRKFTKFTFQYG